MKIYSAPEISGSSVFCEEKLLTPSPIGVEAVQVKVDEYDDTIGGDAGFGDVNLFD